jgi:hypothetical protein
VKASVGHQLDREKRKIIARLAPLMGGKEPKNPGAPGPACHSGTPPWRALQATSTRTDGKTEPLQDADLATRARPDLLADFLSGKPIVTP